MYSKRSLPDAISHRGLHASVPENSIPAFLAAIDAGTDAIELDVHASVDDTLFVHHDPGIPVPSADGGTRAIAQMDSGEISRLRLPGDVGIPTLDDTLEAIGERARVFIEIKARAIEETVARCLRRHSARSPLYAVHSFDHRAAKRMLELFPSVRTGILQVAYPVDSCAVMRAAGASDLWQAAEFVDPSLVVNVHACGGRVIAWTANDESVWTALASAGVDGICTDRVDAYVAWREQQSAVDSRESTLSTDGALNGG
ncbi:MAG: glycerophosphodiester phosphodiesterase [Gemmatimonadales bacterium]